MVDDPRDVAGRALVFKIKRLIAMQSTDGAWSHVRWGDEREWAHVRKRGLDDLGSAVNELAKPLGWTAPEAP